VDTPTPTTTLSLFIKAGTRYENRNTLSCAQFLKRLAFKGTSEKSTIRLIRDLEHIGSYFSADVSREYLSYHIKGLNYTDRTNSVNLAIEAESLRYIMNPLLLEYEIEAVRPILENDAAEAQGKSHHQSDGIYSFGSL
jgi:predicted Zn-dependent peptidase